MPDDLTAMSAAALHEMFRAAAAKNDLPSMASIIAEAARRVPSKAEQLLKPPLS